MSREERLIVTHAYFGIDEDIIWDVVQNGVPGLQALVAHILETEY